MRKQTRKTIADKIRKYMKENGVTFTDTNPFPVSFKTIWLILDADKRDVNRAFTTRTQTRMIEFFGLDYCQDGHDLQIINEI